MTYSADRLPMRIITAIALFILITTVSSCRTHRNNLNYFTSIQDQISGVLKGASHDIKIKPDDELSITVNSQSAVASAPYNLPMFNEMTQGDLINSVSGKSYTSTPVTQTYIVNKKGDITMPRLGEIHVAGMTIDELTQLITEKVSLEVKDPVVRVNLLNFNVNVLGEVRSPQRINVSGERYSVLDALAAAGDITQYGVRDNVIVIREQPDGTIAYHRINLQDAASLSSPFYYLQQNDIVYVEPNDIKASNSRYDSMNSYKLSAISTIVSASSVIASLVIALTVK